MKTNVLLIFLIPIFFVSCNKTSKLEPLKWKTLDGKYCLYDQDNNLTTSCDLIQLIKKDCGYIFGMSKKEKCEGLESYEGFLDKNQVFIRIIRDDNDLYYLRCKYQYQHRFVDVYIYVEEESLDFRDYSTNTYVHYDSKENKVVYEHNYNKENGDYVKEKYFEDEAVEMLNQKIYQWLFMMNLLCEE